MARKTEKTSGATYVTTGKRGKGFGLQVPITHPAFCLCTTSQKLPAEKRANPHTIRIRRQAKATTERQAIAEADRLKEKLEAELRNAIECARAQQRAIGGTATLRDIANDYAAHEQRTGKRYDRDRYVIEGIVAYFGEDRDPATISKKDYMRWRATMEKRGLAMSTIDRRSTTLIAILNRARKWEHIASHQLDHVDKPKPAYGRPVAYTPRQIATILGPAMSAYEAEQRAALAAFKPATHRLPPSVVPLRGIVLIATYTMMRPTNNLSLKWENVELHPTEDRGSFRLFKHKNASKGVAAEGALHPALVKYLRGIAPARRSGYIHPNPATNEPYVNIRTQWRRLIAIANTMLEPEERIGGRAEDIYVLRATGASLLAAAGADPVLICNMMGDAQLETIRRHYFASHLDVMQAAVNRLAIEL